jgi:DNA invertase Pin-like site-specific DNA recombinase
MIFSQRLDNLKVHQDVIKSVFLTLCVNRVASLLVDFSFWPKIHIKHQIRLFLGEHIRGFIYDLQQNLKQQITSLRILLLLLLLPSGGGVQIDLEKYEQTDNQSVDDEKDVDGSEQTDDAPIDDSPKGIIYARVSSEAQTDEADGDEGENDDPISDEGSIKGQAEEMEKIADQKGIKLPYDPITDKAQTGTDFDRDGIEEVFEKAKQPEISYLLVEKVDRIGRNAPETLFYIYKLQSKCGVTLLTSKGIEQDVSEAEGLLHTTLMSLMAQVQNDLRTTKARKERVRGFLKKKNWKCKSPTIPLGYNETDDGWLTIAPEEKLIVRDLFQKFVECETYSETRRYIEEKYGKHILDGHRVKTLLQHSVYIGEPRVPEEWLIETTYENDLDEQELHLLEEDDTSEIDVSEEVFHQAQEIIERKNEHGSTDDDTEDLQDFLEEFSLFAVIQGSEPATLLHDCGTPFVKNGQVTIDGQERKVHKYYCPECDEKVDPEDCYRRWPKEHELEQIRLIQQVLDGESTLFGEGN